MIFHIFPNGKFLKSFYRKYTELISDKDVFYIFGSKDSGAKIIDNNVVYDKDFSNKVCEIKFLLKNIKKAEYIVFHSLFFSYLLFFLVTGESYKYGKKMGWVIWGGDLYDSYYQEQSEKRIKVQLKCLLRQIIFKNIKYVIGIKEDYDNFNKYYKNSACFLPAIYHYELFENSDTENKNLIMIGHSAHSSSRHIETYKYICKYKICNNDIIYSNLSYGNTDKDYIKDVIETGRQLFGDRYLPDLTFSSYEQYMKKLAKVKVAIFNNNRSQGFCNIANMIYYGAKIYMNPQNNLYFFFKRKGVLIYTMDELGEGFDTEFNNDEKKKNSVIIEKLFSDDKFVYEWTAFRTAKYEEE